MVRRIVPDSGLGQFFVGRQLQRQLDRGDDIRGNARSANGHTVTYFVSRGSTTSANSLFNGVGECGGYALATPDGKVRVSGICTRKMNDGASESDVFAMEPGAERGTWKQIAGTGVLADKHYSGWWKSVISDGKAEMGIWGGTCN